jgi:cbb3-type cytochrome oxidase subunit 1
MQVKRAPSRARRKVGHIYVANWFFGAYILTVALLHIVNSAAVPVTLWKSYSAYAGVQDATWLLMAGPAAVVVASIVSAILAIATADPLVSEYNVRTEGAAKKAEVPWRGD